MRKTARWRSARADMSGAGIPDIELGAQIAIGHGYDVQQDHDKDHLIVHIPPAEHVDQDWIDWYRRLARLKGIAAHAEDRPEGGMVRLDVPGYIERDRIRSLLDTARALLKEADEATRKPPPMAEAEYAVREWWSQQSR